MIAVVVALTLATQPRPDVLIALARDGWTAARAAARDGGSPESLAPARRTIAEIEKLAHGTVWQLHGEYATAVIAAAMAAAQNEHGELDLQLTHARSISERLATSMSKAQWPLAIDDAAAELYLSVYRYGDAAKVYHRAGRHAAACDAYRRGVKALTGAALEEARTYLKSCP